MTSGVGDPASGVSPPRRREDASRSRPLGLPRLLSDRVCVACPGVTCACEMSRCTSINPAIVGGFDDAGVVVSDRVSWSPYP